MRDDEEGRNYQKRITNKNWKYETKITSKNKWEYEKEVTT